MIGIDELLDRAMAAAESDECIGFCILCGEQVEGVEPDARKYECPECGRKAVFGAAEIILELGF